MTDGLKIRPTSLGTRAALTDARQLFSHEHVHDAAAAEDGLHDDAAGAVVGDFADDRGPAAQGMRLQGRQRRVGLGRGDDADDLSLVSEIQRVEAQDLAEAPDLGADRRASTENRRSASNLA